VNGALALRSAGRRNCRSKYDERLAVIPSGVRHSWRLGRGERAAIRIGEVVCMAAIFVIFFLEMACFDALLHTVL